MPTPTNPLAASTDTVENGAAFRAERQGGGLATVTPLTARARDWLRANVDEEARWLGEALVLKTRYFPLIADAIIAAGFRFERDTLPN